MLICLKFKLFNNRKPNPGRNDSGRVGFIYFLMVWLNAVWTVEKYLYQFAWIVMEKGKRLQSRRKRVNKKLKWREKGIVNRSSGPVCLCVQSPEPIVRNGDGGWTNYRHADFSGRFARRCYTVPGERATSCRTRNPSSDHDACPLFRPWSRPPPSQILLSSRGQRFSFDRYDGMECHFLNV